MGIFKCTVKKRPVPAQVCFPGTGLNNNRTIIKLAVCFVYFSNANSTSFDQWGSQSQ